MMWRQLPEPNQSSIPLSMQFVQQSDFMQRM
jgi:hypothetical protein